MLDELDDLGVPSPEETRYIVRRAVAEADPDDLRRSSVKNAQPMKVFVLGHQDKSIRPGVRPDLPVAGSRESSPAHVD
jgi:hypothetical protein